MTESLRTVVLLIDYDNLQICYSRDAPGTQLDLGAVMALAQTYGRVVVARAYAEWNLLSERLQVYKSGIEPAFAPVMRPEGSNREGKSLADTVMVADGVDLLWTHRPDALVLVTSDKDMIPLARLAKQRGTLLVVLGSDLTAVPLIEMANDFVTYRHLVRELGRPREQLAAPRLREEPRERRLSEPSGHREVAAAREASLREPRSFTNRRPRSEPLSRPALGAVAAPPAPPVVPAAGPEIAPPPPYPVAERAPAGPEEVALEGEAPTLQRRRRRRGGRGRRGPLDHDDQFETTHEELAEAGEAEAEAVAEALGLVGAVPLAEVEIAAASPDDLENAAAPAAEAAPELPPGPRGLRRRRRTPRPETLAALESPAEPLPTSTRAVAAPAETATLRPWERWPEPRPQPIPLRSATRLPTSEPEPPLSAPTEAKTAVLEPDVAATAPVTEAESTLSEPPVAEASAVTVEAAPPAEAAPEEGTPEAEEKPARPRRRRVRRTPAAEESAEPTSVES